MVKSLDPQEISDVSVQMRSPTVPGMYQGQWRMCTATGLFYGGRNSQKIYFVSEEVFKVASCIYFICFINQFIFNINSSNFFLSQEAGFV